MKYITVVILTLMALTLFFINDSHAFSFLGMEFFSKKKTEIKTELSAVKQDANKDIVNRLSGIEANMKEMNNTMNSNFTALDKSMKAGRDMNITNDPKLLWKIIAGLIGIIMYLLRDTVANRKWLQNALKSKEEYKHKANGGTK